MTVILPAVGQRGGTYVQSGRRQEHVSGLSDVCSVEAVVIGHVGMVVVLQGHHVGDERVHRDPERLQQISLLPPRQQKKKKKNAVKNKRRRLGSSFIQRLLKVSCACLSPGKWQT